MSVEIGGHWSSLYLWWKDICYGECWNGGEKNWSIEESHRSRMSAFFSFFSLLRLGEGKRKVPNVCNIWNVILFVYKRAKKIRTGSKVHLKSKQLQISNAKVVVFVRVWCFLCSGSSFAFSFTFSFLFLHLLPFPRVLCYNFSFSLSCCCCSCSCSCFSFSLTDSLARVFFLLFHAYIALAIGLNYGRAKKKAKQV